MKTSKAIRELLERKGVKPTGCAEKDIILAKEFLPEDRKEYVKRINLNNGE